MNKFEQAHENKDEKPVEVHLATINQTLDTDELNEFINELPERIEYTKGQIKKAEGIISQGGFKIGPVVIRTPSVDSAELQLPILKQDLEMLEKAEVEALEKKNAL
ncbi:MAG TPA: hypothetical protein VJH94_00025 [Candidatus Paceibacterota bacterium]